MNNKIELKEENINKVKPKMVIWNLRFVMAQRLRARVQQYRAKKMVEKELSELPLMGDAIAELLHRGLEAAGFPSEA